MKHWRLTSLERLVLRVFLCILWSSITFSESTFGKKCSSDYECGTYLSITKMACVDGFCTCKDSRDMILSESTLTPECDSIQFLVNRYCESESWGNLKPVDCKENSTCVKYKGCICDEGFFKIGSNCREVIYRDVLQPCYIKDDEVYACDLSQHSLCKSRKCVCFDSFLPNKTSGKCEREEDFLSINNLTEYRALPGQYCKYESQCVDGLECRNYACSCPSPCRYKEKEQVCDCGKVGSPVGPIIVGVILGAIIIGFWIRMIGKTLDRHKEKEAALREPVPSSDPPPSQSYPLAPVASSSPTRSTNVNSPIQNEDSAAIPPKQGMNDSIPSNPENPTAPSAAPLGFQGSGPLDYSPSPYTPLVPSYPSGVPDCSPPPYSPYPPQTAGLPYNPPSSNQSDPSALPIAAQMSTAPYPPTAPSGSGPTPALPTTYPNPSSMAYPPPPPYTPN